MNHYWVIDKDGVNCNAASDPLTLDEALEMIEEMKADPGEQGTQPWTIQSEQERYGDC